MKEGDETNDLILCLKDLKNKNSSLLTTISNFDLLLEGLNELNDMIEMYEIKNSIISQIKFLLVNTIFDDEINNFDGHMLHTVISSGPGTGKSAVAVILAKIWTSLGLFKKDITKNPIKKLKVDNSEDKQTITRLQNSIKDIKNNLKETNSKLNMFRIKELRREIEKIKNKDFSYLNCLKLLDDIIKEEEVSKIIIENILKNDASQTLNMDEIIKNFPPTFINFPINPVMSDLEPKKFDLIRIVSREDFVAGFVGQTAIKTEKLLKDSIGKVLFIDEAYSLINDEKDTFGSECLTTLNRFMSEHSSEIVIIFAGYKDLLERTIFKAQPGLKRRCTWNFEIKPYTEFGLSKIFEKQLKNNGWMLSEDLDIISFFKENINQFPYYGGDTLKLAFYCKICYSTQVFDYKYPNEKIINQKILNKALKYLKDDLNKKSEERNLTMYI